MTKNTWIGTCGRVLATTCRCTWVCQDVRPWPASHPGGVLSEEGPSTEQGLPPVM
jgi:hypothetical protein